MKKNICLPWVLVALFVALVVNPFSQSVSAQDGEITSPHLPEQLQQRIFDRNQIERGATPDLSAPEGIDQPLGILPYYLGSEYMHEWTDGVFSAWNFSTGNYDLLLKHTILEEPVVIASTSGDELYFRLSRDSSLETP